MLMTPIGLEGQRKYLTRPETERFLCAARNHDLQVDAFCGLMAGTGCRISEALMTAPANIDFEAQLVIFESLKKRRKHVYRAIPVSPALLVSLARLIRLRAVGRHEVLWTWSRMTAYRKITQVMEDADIIGPWATPRGLRHGFGVRAVQSGVPLHLVQRWLGHADMKTTAIYTSAVGQEEREIASWTWLGGKTRGGEGAKPLSTKHKTPILPTDI